MNGVYSATSLGAIKSQLDVQQANPGIQGAGKIVLGTAAKFAVTFFAAFECCFWKVSSQLLANRATLLNSRANEAADVFVQAVKSLNRPYAPQVQIIETGRLFWRKTIKKVTEGPTLAQLVGNGVKETAHYPIGFVQKNPEAVSNALLFSAAATALYYFGPNLFSVDSSSPAPTSTLTPDIPAVSISARAPSLVTPSYEAPVEDVYYVASKMYLSALLYLAKKCYDRYSQKCFQHTRSTSKPTRKKVQTVEIHGKPMRADERGNPLKIRNCLVLVLANGAQLLADKQTNLVKFGGHCALVLPNGAQILADEQGTPLKFENYCVFIASNEALLLADEHGNPVKVEQDKYGSRYIRMLSTGVFYLVYFVSDRYEFVRDKNWKYINVDITEKSTIIIKNDEKSS